MQYETITMPDAGIGSFLTSNLDEIDDNVLMFGNAGGINSMKEVADRMAKMGREGDTFVVHASEKEVMVPREVAENNPQLLAQIKDAIAAEGADPEAYIVGSDRNSINPMTGQREFFLKKLVKGVKKVFKKAAKIILPVAINFIAPGLGTIASAAIGAGIGGLIQGESLGDALKSAALGGITAGVASGVSGVLSGGTFMEGVQGGLPASYTPGSGIAGVIPNASDFAIRGFKDTPSYGLNPLKSGYAANQTYATASTPPPFDTVSRINELTSAGLAEANATTIALQEAKLANAAAAGAGSSSFLKKAAMYGGLGLGATALAGGFDPIPAEEVTEIAGTDITDMSDPSNPLADPLKIIEANPDQYRVGQPPATTYFTPSQITVPSAALYGPSQGTIANLYANLTPVGAGTNVITPSATASGEAPAKSEVAEVVIPGYDPTVTGMRPATLYGVDAQGNPVFTPYYSDPILPAAYAANGGAMNFPRRTGQIEGPGTETSDDIPAMLSDGEFVMTAKAVKNAGGGSREKGFRKMYDIMRSFEGGAVA
tara:strand:- start:1153 stop:2781 length:1629 start_codon:yes stop_codon:yes gene_type:complete